MSYLQPDVENDTDYFTPSEIGEDEDDAMRSDEEPPSTPIIIPARSPLRRSFGIFCTGKGRGAFIGGSNRHSSGERDHAKFSPSRGELLHA